MISTTRKGGLTEKTTPKGVFFLSVSKNYKLLFSGAPH